VIVVQVLARAMSENVARLEHTLREVAKEARQSPGCLSYAWFRSPDAEREIFLHAEFDTDEAFAQYRTGPVGKKFVEHVAPLFDGRPSFKLLDATVREQG